eukprot:7126105-Lingulodinium_polyedra.AAC.1
MSRGPCANACRGVCPEEGGPDHREGLQTLHHGVVACQVLTARDARRGRTATVQQCWGVRGVRMQGHA